MRVCGGVEVGRGGVVGGRGDGGGLPSQAALCFLCLPSSVTCK